VDIDSGPDIYMGCRDCAIMCCGGYITAIKEDVVWMISMTDSSGKGICLFSILHPGHYGRG
jgi:hypothetical protein